MHELVERKSEEVLQQKAFIRSFLAQDFLTGNSSLPSLAPSEHSPSYENFNVDFETYVNK